jgi:hypothetical protein
MSKKMQWTVEEAHKQHISNRGRIIPEPKDVKDKDITDADRHLLKVAKETEGMADEERIKHIHHVLGKCLPYLTKCFVMNHETNEDRVESIKSRLLSAYKACKNDGYIENNRSLLRAINKLEFTRLNRDDRFDLLEVLEYVEEFDEDMSQLKDTIYFLDRMAIYIKNPLKV